MSTTTPNLGLTKPAPGGDDEAWDVMLNGNADILDAVVQAAQDAADAANGNANARLLASLVSSFALSLLADTTDAAMRATLGALAASAVSAFGLTLIDDADAAAARGTLGAPARPASTSGVGYWTAAAISAGANAALILPSGGTWAFFAILRSTTNGAMLGSAASVNAGGTAVAAAGGVSTAWDIGIGWRIA